MRLSQAQRAFDLAMAGEVSPATREWYKKRLESLETVLGDVDVDGITVDDLRRWRAWLIDKERRWEDHPNIPEREGGLSPWTIHGYVRAVKRFFKWLLEEGHLEKNPADRIRLPPIPDEPPKAISREDLEKILNEARASGPRDYALVCFLADTGCRVGGLVGLRLRDLDLERGRATVREKGRGGERKARTVYFGDRTAQALEDWLAVRPDVDDHVFLGQRGPLTTDGVRQLLRRLGRRAGVKGRCNPHSFRHGWARGALEAGADLGTVAQILGHSDIRVTHRSYARWADDELAERHRKFSWLNSPRDE